MSEGIDSTFIDIDDKIINLSNVSNVRIIKKENNYRLIFNMNYSIEMVIKNEKRLISDYIYVVRNTPSELDSIIEKLLKNWYFNSFFIEKSGDGYINIDSVGSIKFDSSKMRVIFNLCHPVTFNTNEITSEFVYVNFNNKTDFTEYVKYVKEFI